MYRVIDNLYLYGTKNTSMKPSFYAYINTYIDSYLILREKIGDNNENDYVYYPSIHLCFHALELFLKQIEEIKQKLDGVAKKGARHHNIVKIWQEVKPFLQSFVYSITVNDIEYLEQIINRYGKIDGANGDINQIFKYPGDDIHPLDRTSISKLLISEEEIKNIQSLLHGILRIECIIKDAKKLKLNNYMIKDIESIVHSANQGYLEIKDIKKKFPKAFRQIIAFLRTYYPVKINYNIEPKIIGVKEIQDIIEMANKIKEIEEYLKNKVMKKPGKQPAFMNVKEFRKTLELLELEDSSMPLKLLKQELDKRLTDMKILSFVDLEMLVELGRNDISLVDYYCMDLNQYNYEEKFRESFLINVRSKIINQRYLEKALCLLGY